jgi:ribonuclease P protein component
MSSSPQVCLRVGIVVPRHGQTAVERNLLKRRLRELVRIHLLPSGLRITLVIWTRRPCYTLTFDELRSEVLELMKRIPSTTDAL